MSSSFYLNINYYILLTLLFSYLLISQTISTTNNKNKNKNNNQKQNNDNGRVRDHFHKYYDIPFPLSLKKEVISSIKSMFDFSFDSYMKFAFPHDELKPITGLYTDSLPELGNAKNKNNKYNGLSLTLIDSLDSLLLFNRTNEFINAYKYLITSLYPNTTYNTPNNKYKFSGFNIDIRVHLFETNIRILGGLLSAHSLLTHPKWKNIFFNDNNEIDFQYNDEFLTLAIDLGDRLLPAFDTSNNIPYAWINLSRGILTGETRDTCTAGVGTLMLEMSLLSYLSGNSAYFVASHRALLSLWKLRNINNNLLGNSFNGFNLKWSNKNSGIGAGIDSFYEYLVKSYIYLGYDYYWDIFQLSYNSAIKYLRKGPWYIEINMQTSKPAHYHFNSLQSFWPSIQILIGDIPLSLSTIDAFFSIWYSYNGLPERFLLNSNQPHYTENQYPLRPELIESILYAYQSLKNNKKITSTATSNNSNYHHYISNDYYLWLGYEIFITIQNRTKTNHGYTVLSNILNGNKADYMPSYFLAETCKYLLLLFDDNNILNKKSNMDYIFTTEGHIFPIYNDMREYIESIIYDPKNKDLIDLEDDTYVMYDKYDQFDQHDDINDDDEEIELDDDNDDDDDHQQQKRKKHKIKTNKTSKKKPKNNKYQYNSLNEIKARSIIVSNDIESIFIYQHPYSAICPASPFYYYVLMHYNKNTNSKYNKQYNNINNNNDDGMWYLWHLIKKTFGHKDDAYKNKQISAINNNNNNNINIGQQCPIQPKIEKKKIGNNPSTENKWILSNNNIVRISHDVGHFTINFDDHIETLNIFNLGTNLIEITNAVPLISKYSSFYPYYEYILKQTENKQITINQKYNKLNDLSIGYLFENVGPTRYEIRLKSSALISCYQNTIYDLLIKSVVDDKDDKYDDEILTRIFTYAPPIININSKTTIKASNAYFKTETIGVTKNELLKNDNQCYIERVLTSGILINAKSPSTSCTFPDNLAKLIEDNINNNNNNNNNDISYIVLTDRGECTFYDKINTLYKNHNNIINGIIVGNVVETSNGNIFTMGSDGTENKINIPSFMINKLSYNALKQCSLYNNNNNIFMEIEMIEILTRCQEENISQLNIHGINSHFYVSSLSNSGFVVTQDRDIFKLSSPQ